MGRPSNTAMLEFDKPQALMNCFLILDNISNLIIPILFTIIIYQSIYKLDIIFDFLYLFLTFIATFVGIVPLQILSATVSVKVVMTRSEFCDKEAYSNSIAYTTLFFLTPPSLQM